MLTADRIGQKDGEMVCGFDPKVQILEEWRLLRQHFPGNVLMYCLNLFHLYPEEKVYAFLPGCTNFSNLGASETIAFWTIISLFCIKELKGCCSDSFKLLFGLFFLY